MRRLSWRNLIHDKVRFGVTLTGVVFAVILVAIQIGLLVGFSRATSDIIHHSGADLWIRSKDVPYIEVGVVFSERKLYQARAVPGVQWAEKFILQFIDWKRPDGSNEGGMVLGFNPDRPLGGPWNLTAGQIEDLKADDTIIIDELYQEKLGVTHLGQVVEINNRRAKVVGFTRGIRTFTTSPAIFTSFKNALNYANFREDQTQYILVKVAPGYDVEQVRRELGLRIKDVDISTAAEFGQMTRDYWLFSTGAGVTVIVAAILGLIVGVVVVAQTIYASTVDHLKEYGTLKAMGADNSYIYRVIIEQAVISAVIGYVLGISVSLLVVQVSQNGVTAIFMPWQVGLGLFVLTLMMCIGASIVSIKKVTRIDPAMVFKG